MKCQSGVLAGTSFSLQLTKQKVKTSHNRTMESFTSKVFGKNRKLLLSPWKTHLNNTNHAQDGGYLFTRRFRTSQTTNPLFHSNVETSKPDGEQDTVAANPYAIKKPYELGSNVVSEDLMENLQRQTHITENSSFAIVEDATDEQRLNWSSSASPAVVVDEACDVAEGPLHQAQKRLRSLPVPDSRPGLQSYKQQHLTPDHTHNTRVSTDLMSLGGVVAFCLPALGALLADPIMSLVDTVCVGQVSSIQLAALGPNTAIFGFIQQVFSFLTTTTTGMVGFRIMRGMNVDAGRVVSNALLSAAALGIATAATMCLMGEHILTAFATHPEVMKAAWTYLVIRAVSIPATLISLVATAACLGQRDSFTPLRVAGLAGLFNVVADVYLVLGPPQWGIAGAAIATTAAQYLSASVYLYTLRNNPNCPLVLRMPQLPELKPFFAASSVLTLRSLCLVCSISYMAYFATSLGTTVIAAHQVAISAFTISQFVPEPLSQCAQSMLARKPGYQPDPREKARQLRLAHLLVGCSVFSGLVMSVALGSASVFPHWFVADKVVQSALRSSGLWLSIAGGLLSTVCVTDGILLAASDLKFCCMMHVLNLVLVAGLFSARSPSALPGIWTIMMIFQLARLVQNILRLRNRELAFVAM